MKRRFFKSASVSATAKWSCQGVTGGHYLVERGHPEDSYIQLLLILTGFPAYSHRIMESSRLEKTFTVKPKTNFTKDCNGVLYLLLVPIFIREILLLVEK